MAKRYLGGGVSFEQKNVYQEFSEESSGGSTTLAGLTDVDISNPTNGQTLVYNATSGKWENGAGGGGASLIMPNINITMTGEDTATATCDMSRADIVSAIENGAICIARITGNMFDGDYSQFASLEGVFGGGEDEDPYIVFIADQLMGGGDIRWCSITILDDAVECFIDYTASAIQNNP